MPTYFMIPKTFAPENRVKPFAIIRNTDSRTGGDSGLTYHNAPAFQENHERHYHRDLRPGTSKLLQDSDTDEALLSLRRAGY